MDAQFLREPVVKIAMTAAVKIRRVGEAVRPIGARNFARITGGKEGGFLALAPLLAGHARWDPAAISAAGSRALARRLAELGVQLAHLHFGGVYGWGIRVPGRSPIPFLRRAGIEVCSTVHLTVSLLDGFCG